MKSDNEFERSTRDPFVVIMRFMRAYTNPTWLKKETPHLLEIQKTGL